MSSSADVVVAGGGLLGAATAYFASRAGLSVTLLEAGDLGSGASGGSFGGVSTSIYRYSEKRVPPHYVAFSQRGMDLYHELQAELGPPLDLAVKGELDLFESEEARPLAEDRVAGLAELGVPVTLLDAAEVQALEPAVSAAVAFATYSPVDAFVTPQYAIWALVQGAVRNGAQVDVSTPVEEVVLERETAVGVRTAAGVVHADWVVLAAGAGTRPLAATAGIDIPLTFSRGQMFVTERVPPLLGTLIHGIKQTSPGTILIGATIEPEIDDTETTVRGARDMLQWGVRLIPGLRDLRLLRSWAAVRPVPIDGYPVLGEAGEVGRLLLAVMHRGVTLAPAVGKVLADLMTSGETDLDISPYDPGRFAGAEAPEPVRRVRDHPDYVY